MIESEISPAAVPGEMFDNMTVNWEGDVLLQEDPGGNSSGRRRKSLGAVGMPEPGTLATLALAGFSGKVQAFRIGSRQ